MICCLGLFIGFYIGNALGGVWGLIAPGIGFLLGFILDMKFTRGCFHKSSHKNESDVTAVEKPVYIASPEIWEERIRESQISSN
ncbi:hypothetical protein LCGC14_0902010 [marine sediment metagenome]|uniref:Uncharacterized protein n=1 Tax=marine sediment metagenome TaxID=412755 RepID=A0A0F9NW39_9ZZZZ